MGATVEKKKQSYVFDRKLTDEEIDELVENYEYDPKYLDPNYDGEDDGPLFDKFGNPTETWIRMKYEDLHNLPVYSEPMTLEEFFAELNELRNEIDDARDKTA